jgi:hypothetical protein
LGLKQGLVEYFTVCVKSEVILTCTYSNMHFDIDCNVSRTS